MSFERLFWIGLIVLFFLSAVILPSEKVFNFKFLASPLKIKDTPELSSKDQIKSNTLQLKYLTQNKSDVLRPFPRETALIIASDIVDNIVNGHSELPDDLLADAIYHVARVLPHFSRCDLLEKINILQDSTILNRLPPRRVVPIITCLCGMWAKTGEAIHCKKLNKILYSLGQNDAEILSYYYIRKTREDYNWQRGLENLDKALSLAAKGQFQTLPYVHLAYANLYYSRGLTKEAYPHLEKFTDTLRKQKNRSWYEFYYAPSKGALLILDKEYHKALKLLSKYQTEVKLQIGVYSAVFAWIIYYKLIANCKLGKFYEAKKNLTLLKQSVDQQPYMKFLLSLGKAFLLATTDNSHYHQYLEAAKKTTGGNYLAIKTFHMHLNK